MSAVKYQDILKQAKDLSSEDQRRLVADLSASEPQGQSRDHTAPGEDELGPVTRRIAAMNLPVSDVETMKREAQEGRLGRIP